MKKEKQKPSRPMATIRERRPRLDRSIINAEHHSGWPVLSDAQAMEAYRNSPIGKQTLRLP